MNILLIFLILAFCFFIAKINKKNLFNPIIIGIATIFSPIILSNKTTPQIFFAFTVSLLLLIFFDLTKNKIIKKILFFIISIYFMFAVLYLTGIVNNKLEIDTQKLFFINDSSLETIKRFQQNALYLPKILRPIIYNYFQIVLMIFIRVINYLWIDKIITYLGFAFIYLIYLSLSKKKNLHLLLISLIVVISATMHRDPNNYLLYLFSLPILVLIFIKNINKINPFILFSTVLITCLYSFL